MEMRHYGETSSLPEVASRERVKHGLKLWIWAHHLEITQIEENPGTFL